MAALRPFLLRWVASRGRWTNRVILVASFGLVFLVIPYPTMHFLGVIPSAEAAVLFRLYGIALLSRAAEHHGVFGVPDPRTVRGGIISDLVFSTLSGSLLAWAIVSGLAGPGTWLVVGLFAAESTGYLVAYAGLRTVTEQELVAALPASASRASRDRASAVHTA